MIQFDSQWLEKIRGSRGPKGVYRNMDLEGRAKRIRSLFIQYLEMEPWRFTGDPPIYLRIKPMGKFPWLDYRWERRNEGSIHYNIPIMDRVYPVVGKFSITLAPKFLKAHEDDLLIMMDYVLYEDSKSVDALRKTFAGPGFGKNRGPRPEEATYESRGKVYDLAAIRKEIENDYLHRETDGLIMWGSRVSVRKMGYFNPNNRRIVVSPALDDSEVPLFVVEHVVHHKLLHNLIPRQRRIAHHRAFREAEREYPHYEKAQKWIHENWRRLAWRKKKTVCTKSQVASPFPRRKDNRKSMGGLFWDELGGA